MTDATAIKIIREEELPEQYAEILEAIGAEPMIKLVKAFGGTALYIPTLKSLCKESIYRKIIKEYTGYNIKEIAKKYEVSESTVYRVSAAFQGVRKKT